MPHDEHIVAYPKAPRRDGACIRTSWSTAPAAAILTPVASLPPRHPVFRRLNAVPHGPAAGGGRTVQMAGRKELVMSLISDLRTSVQVLRHPSDATRDAMAVVVTAGIGSASSSRR